MEIVKVNASDFGVEEKDAKQLTTGLDVVLAERAPLIESYKSVIDMELSIENLPVFKALRLKIVKNRTTGIIKWHTTSKAYFLAGGRFCDALKNKEVLINENMESKLMEAEKHFENLEKKRIEDLNQTRRSECIEFVESEETILPDLGSLPDSIWDNYIIGLKASYTARIEAEKKAEAERIEAEKIEAERIKAEIAENKRIQAENARLRKEAEAKAKQDEADKKERERLAKIEADKQAKKEADLKAKQEEERKAHESELKRIADEKVKEIKERQERNTKRDAELKPYISFIRCYANLLDSTEEGYQKEFKEVKLAANLQWADDKKEADSKAEKERIQDEKNEAARIAHNTEVKKLADELKAKQEAENAEGLRLAQEQADKEKAALAPEKDKIGLWIDSMNINEIDSNEFSMNGQATVNIIQQKFEAFKKWAEEQLLIVN